MNETLKAHQTYSDQDLQELALTALLEQDLLALALLLQDQAALDAEEADRQSIISFGRDGF
jgi:hypothetical protein